MHKLFLKLIRVLIVLTLLISTGTTAGKFQLIPWLSLANTALTATANLVFLYFSSRILFRSQNYSQSKLLVVILIACSLLISSQPFNITFTVAKPLLQLSDDAIFITLGYMSLVYTGLVLYYLISTWFELNKLRIKQA
jgi:hypothetical protein